MPSDGPKQEVVENPGDGSDETAGSSPANISYADIGPIQPTALTTPTDQGASANLPTMPVPSGTDPSDPDAGSADPGAVLSVPPSTVIVAAQEAQNAQDLAAMVSEVPMEEGGGSVGQPVTSDAVVAAQEAQNAQDLAALLSQNPIEQKPSSDGSTDPKAIGGQDSDQSGPDGSQDNPEPSSNQNFSLSLGAATFLVPDSADQEPAGAFDSTYVPENLASGQEWSPVESAPPGGGAEGGAEPSGALAPEEPSSSGTDYDGGGLEGGGESGFDHSGGSSSPEQEESPGEPPPDGN